MATLAIEAAFADGNPGSLRALLAILRPMSSVSVGLLGGLTCSLFTVIHVCPTLRLTPSRLWYSCEYQGL